MCASDAIMSNNTSTTTRGRNRIIHRSVSSNNIATSTANSNSSSNPIGVSRLRQSPKHHHEQQQLLIKPRERRSQSLTRFVSNNIVGSSGDRGGGGGGAAATRRRRSFQQQQSQEEESRQGQDDEQPQQSSSQLSNNTRQRSSSLSSYRISSSATVSSTSTELLNEPGWFSHAFHGSGACTCSLLVGSHHADDHHHSTPASTTDALPHTNDDDDYDHDAQQVVNDGEGESDNVESGNEVGDGSTGKNSTIDHNKQGVLSDNKENDGLADGSRVGGRTEGDKTDGKIGGGIEMNDVEGVVCSTSSNNNLEGAVPFGATDTNMNNTEIQHVNIIITTTAKDDEKVCYENEWNHSQHHDRIMRDIHEVVKHHPTSFSDEPSLLSSSSSLSSSSYASNNHNDNRRHHHQINDALITKVGDLAVENGLLMEKCITLEEELATMKQKISTQKEHSLDENKAMLFMAAISTTMIESFRVGNANLRKLSYFLSTTTADNHRSPCTIDQALASSKVEDTTTSNQMMPITEMKQEEVLVMIQDIQTENDALHVSMKESMQSLIDSSREQMAAMVKTHKATVEEYTSQVNALRHELNMAMSARDVMANEMITLNNENTNITIRLEKANSAAAAEYGAKIAALTEELNERTSSKHELSREMELLRKENHMLSVELEEARSLVIASVHDEIKQEQLVQDIRNSENEEQVLEMERLRNENGRLHESMNEMKNLVSTLMNKLSEESASLKDARESYEQQGEELNVEKMANTYLRDEVESISAEREEAYDACKVLQQEINLLRKKCAKLDERFDSDDSIPSSDDNSKEDKLSELTKVTDTLMKELHQKNEALQAVQSVLKSLKEEQSIIKKTITELRTENAELRDTTSKTKTTSLPPLVPPPPPKSTLQHKASLDSSSSDSSIQSQIIHLEVRLKKVEKENKGLREANNIMSTKLFDEMEKTESLKIANEGLGARICKLVKYIQQNSGGASNGGSCGGEGGASTVGTSISSGKTR